MKEILSKSGLGNMFELKDIIKAVNGRMIKGALDVSVKGVSIDSRGIKKGELFLAIKGENFDGHRFIQQAIVKGASAVIISKKKISVKADIPIVYVKDTTIALGLIAHLHRCKFNIPIIAITGSAGKTTTKEMVAAVLGKRYKLLKNEGTQNNHIGVPLTLLKLKRSHSVAVIEFGTNCFGDIDWLAKITEPTMAIFTNIGESHLEKLGSPKGVFKEKVSLLKYLRFPSKVIFNADDQFLQKIPLQKKSLNLTSFSIENPSDYQAKNIELLKNINIIFKVNNKIIKLKGPGHQNVCNALIAISCGRLLKINYNDIVSSLKNLSLPSGRQSFKRLNNTLIVDDTYNANPVSLKSAISTLDYLKVKGNRILICADMLELGKQAKNLHESLGKFVAQSKIDVLLTFGSYAKYISVTAKKCNKDLDCFHGNSLRDLNKKLKCYSDKGNVFLVKGSRRMKMERVVQFIESMLKEKKK